VGWAAHLVGVDAYRNKALRPGRKYTVTVSQLQMLLVSLPSAV